MKRQFFNLPGNPQMNTPFDQMHIWEWMQVKYNLDQKDDISMFTYLEAVGFKKEEHKLTSEQVMILLYAVSHFFHLKRITNKA